MSKKLSEMTLEELWQLFPIILSEHKDEWAKWYEEECAFLKTFLPENVVITHIGSTAIKGIWAKPIVDIMVEIPETADAKTDGNLSADGALQVPKMKQVRDLLREKGYICMFEEEKRCSFNKGYTEEGFAERVFHIHVRLAGDNDEIAFRDYMNAHPDEAKEYEQLKLGLWKVYEHDRDGYTNAKTEFIRSIMEKARRN